ncbi:MAG: hypothetical protein GTO45_14465 [Candidatus Aminicenantes bacterium]|nr:hypothetical protein [Candidatus Aminicenantes bacterium]NIM79970.1 hypothetical protein [Candidatus Aminicenantes bacterium]NIN19309.1 hypothetical protein [Candidatus Aminicenantes bacterium]NIN43212.1 hypothetical protein [Candidatus Aminicenantes bacterium]NIN85951.1 hypothetical protein [Candidatus Aminicenantes bacterium]
MKKSELFVEEDFQEKYILFIEFQSNHQSTIVYLCRFHQSTIVDTFWSYFFLFYFSCPFLIIYHFPLLWSLVTFVESIDE